MTRAADFDTGSLAADTVQYRRAVSLPNPSCDAPEVASRRSGVGQLATLRQAVQHPERRVGHQAEGQVSGQPPRVRLPWEGSGARGEPQ